MSNKRVQGMGGGLKYCHSAKSQMLIFEFHINLKLIFSHSLQFLEGFPATSHILLSTLKLLQLPDTMPSPGGIDVTHSSKGCLHPTCHFFQEDLEVGHFLLIDDNAAPREERIAVAIHQHTLHHRLREERPLCASTSHAWWPGTCCVAKSTVEHCLHLFIWERASDWAPLSAPPWELPQQGCSRRAHLQEVKEGAGSCGEGSQFPLGFQHGSALPLKVQLLLGNQMLLLPGAQEVHTDCTHPPQQNITQKCIPNSREIMYWDSCGLIASQGLYPLALLSRKVTCLYHASSLWILYPASALPPPCPARRELLRQLADSAQNQRSRHKQDSVQRAQNPAELFTRR